MTVADLDHDGRVPGRPWSIQTYTGRRVDPLELRVDDLEILDVAHALARLCRYNGHCEGFLSVARHSLWVSTRVAVRHPELALAGLLHDAAEAYLGDMPGPVKHSPAMAPFREAEEAIERLIARRWEIPWPMPAAVHEADRYVLREVELPRARLHHDSTPDADEREFLLRFVKLGGKL